MKHLFIRKDWLISVGAIIEKSEDKGSREIPDLVKSWVNVYCWHDNSHAKEFNASGPWEWLKKKPKPSLTVQMGMIDVYKN